tara:strand:+ start:449 stop:925 length:477 start_codon:yes stop_codon:yes gene_type:complete
MRFAYADPPYIGQAKRHYGTEEVDHAALLQQLETFDAWALSCSSPSLFTLLPMCRDDVRIGAWVKPFGIFKPGVNPAYVWEPVLFKGARKRSREEPTARDWVSCNVTLRRGLAGAKPEGFCFWLFELMGLEPDDDFHDLFPGTGAVTQAWERWKTRLV